MITESSEQEQFIDIDHVQHPNKRRRKAVDYVSQTPSILPFQSNSSKLVSNIFPSDAPRLLSNFALLDVEYEGKVYPTVEHAFQAQKYCCTDIPEYSEEFTIGGKILTPLAAKQAGSRSGMKKMKTALDVVQWNSIKLGVMTALIRSKVERYPEVRSILLCARSRGIQLVHTSRSDLEWGAHLNESKTGLKRGQNLLGLIYSQIPLEVNDVAVV